MKHPLLALSAATLILATTAFNVPPSLSAQVRGTPRASFGEPGISPDGATVAFVSGGDIWEVASAGGDARLLVSHPATESRPLFSPDGSRLAFTSTRSGNGDLYTLNFSSGEVVRLTFDDANELVTGWSPDSRSIYFSSTSHDLTGMLDVYRVSVDGGTPMPIAADRYTTEYFAVAAPTGDTLAITARGNAGSQWWRKGHSHLDESEIWLVRTATTPPRYEAVTSGGAKDAWPMWSADAKSLYFMSDRSGAQNIWTQAIGGAAKPVTSFPDGRVLWPSIARDGKTIAFERDFGIWMVETAGGRAREVPITLRGASAGVGVEHRTFTDQIQEMALSPDGKKVALMVRGELFSASAQDGGDAVRLTRTVEEEFGAAWSPDSRRLVYSSARNGTDHLFLYDFATSSETPLTSGTLRDHSPRFSPDGTLIAFERGGRELRVVDPVTKQERLVASGIFMTPRSNEPREIDWSPDSKFLAVVGFGAKTFQNVFVVPVEGGEARPVSFLANGNGTAVAWSPDGTYITFVTSQRTETGRVVRVDLLPRTPRFREDQFRDLFREERPRPPSEPASAAPATSAAPASRAAAAPVNVDFNGLRSRASVLPVGVDVQSQVLSPDGKSLLLVASAEGQENLYVYPMDELSTEPAIARQLTSTAGAKASPQFSPDGKEVYFLDRGRIFTVSLERREPRPLAVTAALDVDFAQEKLAVFTEAWSLLRDQFFDEQMNGVNWSSVRERYELQVAGARTPDEMRRIISMMLGELNASHMGIAAPPQSTQVTVGRLGLDLDRAEYERSGQLRVASLVPLGPAAVSGVAAGDYIRSVGGRATGAKVNLDELLDHTIGRQVTVTVSTAPTGATRDVGVKPVNQATEKALRYRQWVEERRAYVAKASNNRLGYVHMLDMSDAALNQLYLDLDADNHSREGVVVDVRNNNGGFVNVYAIDVFARRGYFQMARRGLPLPPVSSRTSLGQRALELPTILVTNQHSLSDAEDFTEGYRSLKLGKVVGEPTAGWIIYTGSATLVDGSVLRMPSVKIFANDGSPMEMHPRAVDVPVTRPVGESYSGKDVQLDTAVAELLKQIGPPAARPTAPRQ